MNEAWQEATATHHKAPEDLTHNQEVARLYRHSLKLMTSWVIDRATVCEAATAIRAEFDRHTGKDVAYVPRPARVWRGGGGACRCVWRCRLGAGLEALSLCAAPTSAPLGLLSH